MSLARQGLNAFKWSFLGELASKALTPLVFLVLARFLVPEDFGLAAAATAVIAFSMVFSDAGLSKALIQRQEQLEESANCVFWLNLLLGVLLAALILVAAPLIAWFFHDERIAPVVRVLSSQLLLAAFSSVHIALLQRALEFRKLFWIRLLTTGLPAVASIPLAAAGFGYWALVFGTLFGQVAQSATLWLLSAWRPRWGIARGLARELIGFGKWAALSGLLAWFFLWMDALIVGHYLDGHDLGLYRLGNTFALMVMQLVFAPVAQVAYSILSRVQDEQGQVKVRILEYSKFVALLVLPLGGGMFLARTELAAIVFDDSWAGIDAILGVLGITVALSSTVSVMQEGYRAIGRPDVETRIMTVSMLIRLPFYLVSIRYGLPLFVLARLVATVLGVANHLAFGLRYLKISLWDYSRFIRTGLTGTAVMYGFGEFVLRPRMGDLTEVTRALLLVPICAVLYGAVVLLIDRRLLAQLRETLARRRG